MTRLAIYALLTVLAAGALYLYGHRSHPPPGRPGEFTVTGCSFLEGTKVISCSGTYRPDHGPVPDLLVPSLFPRNLYPPGTRLPVWGLPGGVMQLRLAAQPGPPRSVQVTLAGALLLGYVSIFRPATVRRRRAARQGQATAPVARLPAIVRALGSQLVFWVILLALVVGAGYGIYSAVRPGGHTGPAGEFTVGRCDQVAPADYLCEGSFQPDHGPAPPPYDVPALESGISYPKGARLRAYLQTDDQDAEHVRLGLPQPPPWPDRRLVESGLAALALAGFVLLAWFVRRRPRSGRMARP